MSIINPELDWHHSPHRCGCGIDDCELAFYGYYHCACGEHHRLPVAKSGRCPVDVEAETVELVELIELNCNYVMPLYQREALRSAIANQ